MKLNAVRHSACSVLAALGAPMIAIQSLAGHESPQRPHRQVHAKLAAGVQTATVNAARRHGLICLVSRA